MMAVSPSTSTETPLTISSTSCFHRGDTNSASRTASRPAIGGPAGPTSTTSSVMRERATPTSFKRMASRRHASTAKTSVSWLCVKGDPCGAARLCTTTTHFSGMPQAYADRETVGHRAPHADDAERTSASGVCHARHAFTVVVYQGLGLHSPAAGAGYGRIQGNYQGVGAAFIASARHSAWARAGHLVREFVTIRAASAGDISSST